MRLVTMVMVAGLSAVVLQGCFATAVVGTTAVAGSGAYDERTVGRHVDDVAIATKIDAMLIAEKDMPSRWVSVEVVHGVATLTGYLPSQSHIDRAIEITRRVRGVRSVENHLKVGTPAMGSLLSDSWITAKVKAALWNDKVVSGFGIHVETVDGKVYLQGIVSKESDRLRAKRLTRQVDGVTAVIDLMRTE